MPFFPQPPVQGIQQSDPTQSIQAMQPGLTPLMFAQRQAVAPPAFGDMLKYQQQRALGEALMADSNTGPVRTAMEGAGRLGNKLTGAYMANKGLEMESEAKAEMSKWIGKVLSDPNADMSEIGRTLMASGDPQYAAMGKDLFLKSIPEYDTAEHVGTNPETGRPEYFRYGKDGSHLWSGVTPAAKPEDVNGVAVDMWGVPTGSVLPQDPNKPFTTGQGGSPVANQDYQNYEINKAAAGRSSVNVNMPPQQKAFDEALGKQQAERYSGYLTQSDTAQNQLNMLDVLETNLATAPFRGPAAGLLTSATRLTNSLGISDTDTSGAEAAAAMSNQFAMLMRNPAGGAGMPGAMSDADRKFLVQTVPSLSNSPTGATQLIGVMRKLNQRKIEYARMAAEYVEKNGKLDTGFERAASEYVEKNPLFAPAKTTTAKPAGTTRGVPWEIVP